MKTLNREKNKENKRSNSSNPYPSTCTHTRAGAYASNDNTREKQIKNCKIWLTEFLHGNTEGLADDVRAKAKNPGFSKVVLKQARKELGVKTFHQFDENGVTPNWFWAL